MGRRGRDNINFSFHCTDSPVMKTFRNHVDKHYRGKRGNGKQEKKKVRKLTSIFSALYEYETDLETRNSLTYQEDMETNISFFPSLSVKTKLIERKKVISTYQ